jgi:hypothetical protein
MPYCLEEMAPGEYCILNREYRPLGDNDQYGPYNIVDARFKITKKQLAKLEIKRNYRPLTGAATDAGGGGSKIYLYDVSTLPEESEANWRMYMEKLKVLAKCKAIPAKVVAERMAAVVQALQGGKP